MQTSFKKKIAAFLSQEFGRPTTDFLKEIEPSPSLDKGDYTFACFQIAKQLQKKPNEIASHLAQKFPLSSPIEKVEAIGPYLNFFVNKDVYNHEIIDEILLKKNNYGNTIASSSKKILIEYSSPNIAKPFHVGHFRATIIGNTLTRILKTQGHQCVSINYLGDWGTQFGKLITAFKKWGDELHLQQNPIKYLNSLYVRFHDEAIKDPDLEDEARAWFKKCELGDPEAFRLWKLFRELSLEEFNKIYEFLDVTFDEVSGESRYNDAIEATVAELKAKNLATISEGALIVDLETFHMPPALILRKDGASLYLTRDLAALFDRYKRYHFDDIIYVVGDTQQLHFKQLFKIIDLLEYPWAKQCHHVEFGQIRLKDQKMSSRAGTTIFLEELLEKSITLISRIIEEKNPSLKGKADVAQKVGLAAIIFADFGSRRNKNVVFDWNVILNPDGDTGPYVMYTYARASSILRKAGGERTTQHTWKSLVSPEELNLIRHLEKFSSVISATAHTFEPSIIATYLIELSKLFNRFYHEHRVIQEDKDLEQTRLQLVTAARQVLHNGLYLMGIKPVEAL